MIANYKIVGADGRQYGPISAEQIRQWIAEGRVESRTPVFTDGAKDWTFAGLLPEFAPLFAAGAPPTIAPPVHARRTSGFATAGLFCGILAWIFFCCCGGFPFNLIGLVLSLIGWSQISRNPGLYNGHGQAIAGLILSVLSILLLLLGLAWSMATDNFHVSFNHGWN
jgi:hypothetical protein